MEDLALLEFDPERKALIEPGEMYGKRPNAIPRIAVLCFFAEVIEELAAADGAEVISALNAAHGSHKVYAVERHGERIAVFHPGVGAPLCAGFLEEAIALGAQVVVACGGAGAVSPELTMGQIVIPTSAVRDEGTSFHYLPPGRVVDADPEGVAAAVRVLERNGVPHVLGKTWTTDGLYRETPTRIATRRAEGCLTVEMEAAAFFAVAQFRGIRFAQLLYAGDDVSSETWDDRDWTTSPSRRLTFDLALDVALELAG